MCIHRRARGATDRPLYRMQHISMCQEERWVGKEAERASTPSSSFGPSGFSLLNKQREEHSTESSEWRGGFSPEKDDNEKGGGGLDESPLSLSLGSSLIFSLSLISQKRRLLLQFFFAESLDARATMCEEILQEESVDEVVIFRAKKLENDILPRSSIFCTCRNIGGEGLF